MKYLQHTRIDRDAVYKEVVKGKPEIMLHKYYHMLTKDKEERYYNKFLEYTIDRYMYHRDHHKNLSYDERMLIGQAGAVIDGIELLIDRFNETSQILDDWRK